MTLLLQSNSKLNIKNRMADKVSGAGLVIDFRDDYAVKKGVATTASQVLSVEQSHKTAAYRVNGEVVVAEANTPLVGSYRSTVKKGMLAQSQIYFFGKGDTVASKNYLNVTYSSTALVYYVMGGSGSVDIYNEVTGSFIASITEREPFFDYANEEKTVSIRAEAKGDVDYFQAYSSSGFDDRVIRASKSTAGTAILAPSKYSIKQVALQEVLGAEMVGCLVVKIHKPLKVKKVGNMSDFGGSTLSTVVTTFAQVTDGNGKGIYFAHYSNPEGFNGMTHSLRVKDSANAEKTQVVVNDLADAETVILAINFSKTKASAFINGKPVSTYGKPSADIEFASTALSNIYIAAGDDTWSKTGDIMVEQVALYNRNLTMQEMARITDTQGA